MVELLGCPFCGGAPELVDDRTGWFVRCKSCKPYWTVVYGENVRHLDHITAATDEEADRLSSEAFAVVDFEALRQTAIAAWNRRAPQAAGGDWVLVEHSQDADCGCPEEFWERPMSPHVHMHLSAGKVSNGHADNGDWEAQIEVTADTVDQARAAILGWASSLPAAPTASAAEGGEKPSDNAFEHHGEGGPSADNWIKFLEVNGYASPAVVDWLRAALNTENPNG